MTTFDKFSAYWTERGWSEKGPVKTESRIDVPRDGATVRTGTLRIGGSAWAQHTGIEKVEYQLDGAAWQRGRARPRARRDTWVQWAGTVDVRAGEHRLVVRATDMSGYTQTAARADVVPDGATGWHSIGFHARSSLLAEDPQGGQSHGRTGRLPSRSAVRGAAPRRRRSSGSRRLRSCTTPDSRRCRPSGSPARARSSRGPPPSCSCSPSAAPRSSFPGSVRYRNPAPSHGGVWARSALHGGRYFRIRVLELSLTPPHVGARSLGVKQVYYRDDD